MVFKTLIIVFFLFSSIRGNAMSSELSQQERIKIVFNNLRANKLDILDGFYDPNIFFQDPLGVHKGLDEMKKYYQKMYRNVQEIEFVPKEMISSGSKHVFVWQMRLRASGLNGGDLVVVDGNSVIEFNDRNLVSYHRDYFDMGEFIYRYIPVLGWTIDKINRQLR